MDRLYITLIVAMALACIATVEANVFSLGSMIEYLDPKLTSIFGVYSRFNDYGCYCGIGGNGRPIDKVDCCCQAHDECYDKLVTDGYCPASAELSHLYTYTKLRDKATGSKRIVCKNNPSDPCAYHLCQCDAQVASCFAAAEPNYNTAHRNYDRNSRCEAAKGLRAEFCGNNGGN